MMPIRRPIYLWIRFFSLCAILAASCVRLAPVPHASPPAQQPGGVGPAPSATPAPAITATGSSAPITPEPAAAAGTPVLLPQIVAQPVSATLGLFLPSISLSAAAEPPAAPPPAVVTPTLQPVEGGLQLWVDPTLPEGLRAAVQLPPGFSPAAQQDQANLSIQVGEQPLLGRWTYALVAPFPTITQGISSVALRYAWNSQPLERPLLVDESTYAVFTAKWGPAAQGAVRVLPADEILGAAWDSSSWAIVPFEKLEPRWKVLEVDGQSPLRKSFDPCRLRPERAAGAARRPGARPGGELSARL